MGSLVKTTKVSQATPTLLNSYNPTNDQLLGSVAINCAAEVSLIVARSRRASLCWTTTPLTKRIEHIENILLVLKSHADELAQNITREMGKPIHEAHREIEDGLECIRWYLDHAPRQLQADLDHSDAHEIHEICHVPCGVSAVIVPWNFPFLNVVWPLFPNLIVGNTVVLKHSEKTPLFAQRLHELIQPELPEGVFELLTGTKKTGQDLCQDDIDQICFTGSTTSGLQIQHSALDRAAQTGRIIPVHTELGGSAAGIVLEDADVLSSAEAIFRARFENAGQVCDGLKRLLVHRHVYTPLMNALRDLLERRTLGDPSDISTFIGPLVDAQQRAVVQAQIEDARAQGASVQTFGTCPSQGSFHPPTVLLNVNAHMRVWREEVFGPVLPIVVFDHIDEAIALANDSVYGLGGYIYSSDFERIQSVRQRLHTGMVGVGGSYYIRPFVPFTSGGYGLSGTGAYNGHDVFRKLCRMQITSYSKAIYKTHENHAQPTPSVQSADGKKSRAQKTLTEHGIWLRHEDNTVEISAYELPVRLSEQIHNFRISPWAFDEGTRDEDAYFVASYGHERFDQGAPLVRLQSLCPHGHYFHSSHCDCDEQRDLAMKMLVDDPIGGLLVMAAGEKHAGRGIGQVMIAGLYAYGYRTGRDVVTESFNDLHFNRDERDFSASLEVLRRMGLTKIRLLTNNPDKARYAGQATGIEVQEIVPLIGEVTAESLKERLLLTRAGHHYDREELDQATTEAIARNGQHPLKRW